MIPDSIQELLAASVLECKSGSSPAKSRGRAANIHDAIGIILSQRISAVCAAAPLDLSQATPSSACVPNPASPRAKPGEADAMPGIANMFNDLSVS